MSKGLQFTRLTRLWIRRNGTRQFLSHTSVLEGNLPWILGTSENIINTSNIEPDGTGILCARSTWTKTSNQKALAQTHNSMAPNCRMIYIGLEHSTRATDICTSFSMTTLLGKMQFRTSKNLVHSRSIEAIQPSSMDPLKTHGRRVIRNIELTAV